METDRLKTSDKMPVVCHNYLNAGLIVLGLLSFLLCVVFNGLAGSGAAVGGSESHITLLVGGCT